MSLNRPRLGNRHKKPPQRYVCGGFWYKSLTMTYFHRRPSTIIGAKAFHDPVRDGKAWGHLAMVVKRKGVSGAQAYAWARTNLGRSTAPRGVVAYCIVFAFMCMKRYLRRKHHRCAI